MKLSAYLASRAERLELPALGEVLVTAPRVRARVLAGLSGDEAAELSAAMVAEAVLQDGEPVGTAEEWETYAIGQPAAYAELVRALFRVIGLQLEGERENPPPA